MKKILIKGLSEVVAMGVVLYFVTSLSYKAGYKSGAEDGVKVALDTVKVLCDKQVNDSKNVTGIYFEGDTIIYYLSPKKFRDTLYAKKW